MTLTRNELTKTRSVNVIVTRSIWGYYYHKKGENYFKLNYSWFDFTLMRDSEINGDSLMKLTFWSAIYDSLTLLKTIYD